MFFALTLLLGILEQYRKQKEMMLVEMTKTAWHQLFRLQEVWCGVEGGVEKLKVSGCCFAAG